MLGQGKKGTEIKTKFRQIRGQEKAERNGHSGYMEIADIALEVLELVRRSDLYIMTKNQPLLGGCEVSRLLGAWSGYKEEDWMGVLMGAVFSAGCH